MKIKDYVCQCGHSNFVLVNCGVHWGIYCTYCGKWYKWANKNEIGLFWREARTRENN